MKDFDGDLKNSFWILALVALTFPVVMIAPLALPFILGGGLLWFGARQLKKYTAVRNWQVCSGKLLDTEIGCYRVAVNQYGKPRKFFFR